MFPFSGDMMFWRPVTVGPGTRSLLCRLVAGPSECASKMTRPRATYLEREGLRLGRAR